jgi:hypothetical protein
MGPRAGAESYLSSNGGGCRALTMSPVWSTHDVPEIRTQWPPVSRLGGSPEDRAPGQPAGAADHLIDTSERGMSPAPTTSPNGW